MVPVTGLGEAAAGVVMIGPGTAVSWTQLRLMPEFEFGIDEDLHHLHAGTELDGGAHRLPVAPAAGVRDRHAAGDVVAVEVHVDRVARIE